MLFVKTLFPEAGHSFFVSAGRPITCPVNLKLLSLLPTFTKIFDLSKFIFITDFIFVFALFCFLFFYFNFFFLVLFLNETINISHDHVCNVRQTLHFTLNISSKQHILWLLQSKRIVKPNFTTPYLSMRSVFLTPIAVFPSRKHFKIIDRLWISLISPIDKMILIYIICTGFQSLTNVLTNRDI